MYPFAKLNLLYAPPQLSTYNLCVKLFGCEFDKHNNIRQPTVAIPIISANSVYEYPDAFLRPTNHYKLADTLLDATKEYANIVIRTHSEHLLLRLQRRIAEGFPFKDINVFVIGEVETEVTKLKFNKTGHIINYPNGLFGNRMEEVVALYCDEDWEQG